MSERQRVTLTIPATLVPELRQWAEDEQEWWPDGTAFHDDLTDLLERLNEADNREPRR